MSPFPAMKIGENIKSRDRSTNRNRLIRKNQQRLIKTNRNNCRSLSSRRRKLVAAKATVIKVG